MQTVPESLARVCGLPCSDRSRPNAARTARRAAVFSTLSGLCLLSLTSPLHADPADNTSPIPLDLSKKTRIYLPANVSMKSVAPSLLEQPLRFEPNRGQEKVRSRFLTRSGNCLFALRPDSLEMRFQAAVPPNRTGKREALTRDAKSPRGSEKRKTSSLPATARITALFEGARSQATMTAVEPLSGHANYFRGRNPRQWKTNIPFFGKVRVQSMYRGIDMVYYGNQRQLEYDFVVAPGADPKQIRIAFQGARKMWVDRKSGDLRLDTTVGTMTQKAPVVYQEVTVSGKRQRVSIPARYETLSGNRIAFRLGRYDRTRPLVIDPVFSFSTYFGASYSDRAEGVAIGAGDSISVVGVLGGIGVGVGDIFVSRYNRHGQLQYYSLLGGSGTDEPTDIAVDSNGNTYITGRTNSLPSDPFPFPISINAYQSGFGGGNNDAFVTALTTNGVIFYSSYLGGSGDDIGHGIAVSGTNRVYVGGTTTSTNLAPVPDLGFADGFLQCYTIPTNGTAPTRHYARRIGGNSVDELYDVSLLGEGTDQPIVTGYTNSNNFTIVGSSSLTSVSGAGDVFVARYDASGNPLVTGRFGGSQIDVGFSIAGFGETATGWDLYVAGLTSSTNFPITGSPAAPHNAYAGGTSDGFVAYLRQALAVPLHLSYSLYLGTSGLDRLDTISVAYVAPFANSIYVGGIADGNNLPLANWFQSYSGGTDGIIANVNLFTPTFPFISYTGGSGHDWVRGVAGDSDGQVIYAGYTTSTNFPIYWGGQPTNAGDADAFVSRLTKIADTIGYWESSSTGFYMRNANGPGPVDISVSYGLSTDVPIVGDWDGNGSATVGIFRPSNFSWHLKNDHSPGGIPSITPFVFGGAAGDLPIVGDWDGDREDTIGLFRPSNGSWHIRNDNSGGMLHINLNGFGASGDLPVSGDWDGDGIDTIGYYRPSNGGFYLRNNHTQDPMPMSAHITITGYGGVGDVPVTGDWNGDGIDDIGIYRPSNGTFHLNFPNGIYVFTYGPSNRLPIAGNWDAI